MKKVLLTSILVLVFLSMFALQFDGRVPKDATPIKTDAVKDSLAQAVGATSLFSTDGQFYAQVPTCMTSIVYDTISGQILTTATVYDSTTGLFDGMYYTVSGDAGATWSAPAKFMDGGYYQHNSLDLAEDAGIPYVAAVYRSATMRGVWFSMDLYGVGGGGWTTPVLITDTVNYAAYYNQIATSPDAANVTLVAWDWMPVDWRYGYNYSSDYGSSWAGYTTPSIWDPATADCPFVYTEVSIARWGAGSTVYGLMGGEWIEYETRGVMFGMSVSNDGGATWDTIRPLFNGEKLPPFAAISGETLTYYLDTIDNNTPDTIEVKAWWDDAAAQWVDEIGHIDGQTLDWLGSWWHYYDMEYVDGKLIFVSPYPGLTVDYIDANSANPSDGDLYTFVDEWSYILLGYMDVAGGDTEWTWKLFDIHAPIIDTLANVETYRGGYIGCASISYDARDGMVYVTLDDMYDTIGYMSHDLLKYDPASDSGWVSTTPVILNSNADNDIETPKRVDPDGIIHSTFLSGSDDSIYYIGYDVDDVVWTGVFGPDGVEKNSISENISLYNVPSIVKNNGIIEFSLANTSNVRITLYDITGREVKLLVNGSFNAGTHSVNVNGNELSQGIYFAKINAGGFTDSKKIVIVK